MNKQEEEPSFELLQKEERYQKTYSDIGMEEGSRLGNVSGPTWETIIRCIETQRLDADDGVDTIQIPYQILYEAKKTIGKLSYRVQQLMQSEEDLKSQVLQEVESNECLECQVTWLNKKCEKLEMDLKRKRNFEDYLLYDVDRFLKKVQKSD